MKLACTVILLAILSGCATYSPPAVDQLILQVPQELMEEPKPLKKL